MRRPFTTDDSSSAISAGCTSAAGSMETAADSTEPCAGAGYAASGATDRKENAASTNKHPHYEVTSTLYDSWPTELVAGMDSKGGCPVLDTVPQEPFKKSLPSFVRSVLDMPAKKKLKLNWSAYDAPPRHVHGTSLYEWVANIKVGSKKVAIELNFKHAANSLLSLDYFKKLFAFVGFALRLIQENSKKIKASHISIGLSEKGECQLRYYDGSKHYLLVYSDYKKNDYEEILVLSSDTIMLYSIATDGGNTLYFFGAHDKAALITQLTPFANEAMIPNDILLPTDTRIQPPISADIENFSDTTLAEDIRKQFESLIKEYATVGDKSVSAPHPRFLNNHAFLFFPNEAFKHMGKTSRFGTDNTHYINALCLVLSAAQQTQTQLILLPRFRHPHLVNTLIRMPIAKSNLSNVDTKKHLLLLFSFLKAQGITDKSSIADFYRDESSANKAIDFFYKERVFKCYCFFIPKAVALYLCKLLDKPSVVSERLRWVQPIDAERVNASLEHASFFPADSEPRSLMIDYPTASDISQEELSTCFPIK